MNIRVIGGTYGGRTLDTPDGRTTHPMGERIRNAIFNSLAGQLAGAAVLDAFAGTGALGIEALSRGAASALFVERDRIAQKCIQNNMYTLHLANARLIKTTVSNWLETKGDEQFDIIFADPPYHDTQLATVARLAGVLKPGGTLVYSWPERQPTPDIAGLAVVFDRAYAGARVIMYKKPK